MDLGRFTRMAEVGRKEGRKDCQKSAQDPTACLRRAKQNQ